jgi:hypothetical protein
MPNLTVQQAGDRVNKPPIRELGARENVRAKEKPDSPEFYVPRITRRLAKYLLGT